MLHCQKNMFARVSAIGLQVGFGQEVLHHILSTFLRRLSKYNILMKLWLVNLPPLMYPLRNKGLITPSQKKPNG